MPEDSDDDDPDEVFGFITMLNLTERKVTALALLCTVVEKDQMQFRLKQHTKIDRSRANGEDVFAILTTEEATEANWQNVFISLTTSMQHHFENRCTAFKKSPAKTENTTQVFPGTHKCDTHSICILWVCGNNSITFLVTMFK